MKQLNSKFNEHDQLNKALKRRLLLFQHFVQQFKSECLALLREHHVYQSKKQGSQEEIIKVGDVVLMHAGNVPRSSWKLAIVKNLLRGSDGLVRAAEIKTHSGVTNRSINLLYPLEVKTDRCCSSDRDSLLFLGKLNCEKRKEIKFHLTRL